MFGQGYFVIVCLFCTIFYLYEITKISSVILKFSAINWSKKVISGRFDFNSMVKIKKKLTFQKKDGVKRGEFFFFFQQNEFYNLALSVLFAHT